MKIGILTHPLRFNFGGIIQNFALQMVLRKMGHDVYTIDWNDDKSFIYMILSYMKRLFLRFILQRGDIPVNFFVNLTRKQFLRINEKNLKFIDKNIKRTEYISSPKKLTHINNMGFDAIVVGSDQVWLEQFVPTMYLDFLYSNQNIRRVAYAASFGKEDWTYSKKSTDIAKFYVEKFNAVSVRESSGVKLCDKYLGVSATWVLDPTLLLTSGQYDQIIDNDEDLSPKKPYVMTYVLDPSLRKTNIINSIAEKFGLEIFAVSARNEKAHLFEKASSISTWLSGFKNSRYVITDSFHGMVFSILYKKPFLAIGNSERGMARFVSLLGILGLEDRLVLDKDDMCTILNKGLKNIDFTKVHGKLEEFRHISIDFLVNSLKND